MTRRRLLTTVMASALLIAGTALADTPVRRQGADTAPFSSTVWAGDTLYVAGMLPEASVPPGAPPGTRAAISGDTRAQTTSVLQAIQRTLRAQGLDLGDIVQMRVYLVGVPGLDGRMDFAGMNAAYGQFFGTREQPNKPVRATVQVAGLAAPGALVEIEVVAVKSGAVRVSAAASAP